MTKYLVIAAILAGYASNASASTLGLLAGMLEETARVTIVEPPEPTVFGPVLDTEEVEIDAVGSLSRSSTSEIEIEPPVIGETGNCYREAPLTNEEVMERIWDRRR